MSYLMRLVQEEGSAFLLVLSPLPARPRTTRIDWFQVVQCVKADYQQGSVWPQLPLHLHVLDLSSTPTAHQHHTNHGFQSHGNLCLTRECETYFFDTEIKLYASLNPQSSLHLQWVCSEPNEQTQDLSDTFAWYLKDHQKDIVSDEHRRRYISLSKHC